MPDNGDSHAFHEGEQNWFDRLLKWAMPNGTVMRRWLAVAMIGGTLFGIIAIVLINRTSDNTSRQGQAFCLQIEYLSQPRLRDDPETTELVQELRRLVVGCPRDKDEPIKPVPSP